MTYHQIKIMSWSAQHPLTCGQQENVYDKPLKKQSVLYIALKNLKTIIISRVPTQCNNLQSRYSFK